MYEKVKLLRPHLRYIVFMTTYSFLSQMDAKHESRLNKLWTKPFAQENI